MSPFLCLAALFMLTNPANADTVLFSNPCNSSEDFLTSGSAFVDFGAFGDCPSSGSACAKISEHYMQTKSGDIDTTGYTDIALLFDAVFMNWDLNVDAETKFTVKGYHSVSVEEIIMTHSTANGTVLGTAPRSFEYALGSWAENYESMQIQFELSKNGTEASSAVVYIDNIVVKSITNIDGTTTTELVSDSTTTDQSMTSDTDGTTEPTTEPTADPLPLSDSLSAEDQYELVTFGFLAITGFIIIASFIDAHYVPKRRNDFYSGSAVVTASFQTLDLISDIFFGAKMLSWLYTPCTLDQCQRSILHSLCTERQFVADENCNANGVVQGYE